MDNKDVFTGKTVEEAVEAGLAALGITREEAEITVIEEGKKKIFGSVKAKVAVTRRASDGERAAAFIDGLFEILKIRFKSGFPFKIVILRQNNRVAQKINSCFLGLEWHERSPFKKRKPTFIKRWADVRNRYR